MSYPQITEPGIYFNMSEEDYHNDPALSCSGIKKLLCDPEQFWYENKHLNPDAPENKTSPAAERGTMWHHQLLLQDTFDQHYVKGFDPADYPDAIICNNLNELKDAMAEKGIEFKSTWNSAKLLDAVNIMAPDEIIYSKDKIKATDEEDRIVVKCEDWHDMLYAMGKIDGHPKLSDIFKNGYPEVSIFWLDEDTGIPCKCRIDWMKTSVSVDYKTMALMRGANFDTTCRNKLRFENYDLQEVMYTQGRREIAKLIAKSWDDKKNWWGAVHGKVSMEFMTEFLASKKALFGFVFQRTERPCSLRGIYAPESHDISCAWGQGMEKFGLGLETYRQCWELYGKNPWIDQRGIVAVEDHEIYYP